MRSSKSPGRGPTTSRLAAGPAGGLRRRVSRSNPNPGPRGEGLTQARATGCSGNVAGLKGDTSLQPVGDRQVDVAATTRERPDQFQNLVMSQWIQRIPPCAGTDLHHIIPAVEYCAPPFNHVCMPALPLTHHEILELAAPFNRRGRHVDLPASDRLERRLLFKSVDHPAEGACPVTQETLKLESLGTGTCRLTRTLTRCDSPPATLTAMGPDPGALLALMDSVPPLDSFAPARAISPRAVTRWNR